MYLREVAVHVPDLTIAQNDDPNAPDLLAEGWIWGFTIPSLGVFCGQVRTNEPLDGFSFDVAALPPAGPTQPSSRVRFLGTVTHRSGQVLSFLGTGTVASCDVARAFGTPDRIIDFTPYMTHGGWLLDVGPILTTALQQGQSVETIMDGQCLTLHYPRDGIYFNFVDGIVSSVAVVRAN